MTNPTFFQEMLETLQKRGAITAPDAVKFTENYAYFEEQRTRILTEFKGQWVAALSRQLYVDNHLEPLERQLDKLPENRFAYIEQIQP